MTARERMPKVKMVMGLAYESIGWAETAGITGGLVNRPAFRHSATSWL